MAAISNTPFQIHFQCFADWFEFHWNLFLMIQLTISQHWFRLWLGAEQPTNHYLNQCWPSYLMHICGTRCGWVNIVLCYSGLKARKVWIFKVETWCWKMSLLHNWHSHCAPAPRRITIFDRYVWLIWSRHQKNKFIQPVTIMMILWYMELSSSWIDLAIVLMCINLNKTIQFMSI